MRILSFQRLAHVSRSAHTIHTSLIAAAFASAGAPCYTFPGDPACARIGFRRSNQAPQWIRELYQYLDFKNLPSDLHFLPINNRQRGFYGFLFRLAMFNALRRCAFNTPKNDLCVCYTASVKDAAIALFLKRFHPNRKNIRVVFEIHHLVSKLKKGRAARRFYAMEKRAFSACDLVVFNCEALREQARGYLPEPRQAIVSPLGFNQRAIHPVRAPGAPEPSLESGRVQLAYVGSLQQGKGLENLIQALSLLSDEYFLTIIGGREQSTLEALQNYSSSLGVSDRVKFTGRVAQHSMPALLEKCDIFVIPLETEINYLAPMKMFEAIGFAVPVVATPMPSLQEMMKDRENALFSESPAPEHLAEAIRELGRNAELRGQMRLANEKLSETLTVEMRARKLVSEFERLWS